MDQLQLTLNQPIKLIRDGETDPTIRLWSKIDCHR